MVMGVEQGASAARENPALAISPVGNGRGGPYRIRPGQLTEYREGRAHDHCPARSSNLGHFLVRRLCTDLGADRRRLRLTRDPLTDTTASFAPGDEARIFASGCDAYVSKPFNVAEVLRLVEQWSRPR